MKDNKKDFLEKNVSILKLIKSKYKSFPKIQKKIAEYILKNTSNIIKITISELADLAGAKSEASIVKFYRNLGFDSFTDFKINLAAELAGNTFYYVYDDITVDDNIETIKNKIFTGSIKVLEDNLNSINTENLEKAVDLIEKANRIVFVGFASSAAIAMYAHFHFSLLGLNCYFCLDSHVNSVIISNLDKNDLIFAISYSGESKDIVIQSKQVKPLVKVIALTGFENSSLAKISDICIVTTSKEMNYRTDAMASRIVQLAVIDVLFTALAIRKGKSGLDKLLKSRQSLSYLKF